MRKIESYEDFILFSRELPDTTTVAERVERLRPHVIHLVLQLEDVEQIRHVLKEYCSRTGGQRIDDLAAEEKYLKDVMLDHWVRVVVQQALRSDEGFSLITLMHVLDTLSCSEYLKGNALNNALTSYYHKAPLELRVNYLLKLKNALALALVSKSHLFRSNMFATLVRWLNGAIDFTDVSEVMLSLNFIRAVFDHERAKQCADNWLPKCIDCLIRLGRDGELLALVMVATFYSEKGEYWIALDKYYEEKKFVSAAAIKGFVLLQTDNKLDLPLDDIEAYFPLTDDTVAGFVGYIGKFDDKKGVISYLADRLARQFQFPPDDSRYKAIRIAILHAPLSQKLKFKYVIDKTSLETLLTTVELFLDAQVSSVDLELQWSIWLYLEDMRREGKSAKATFADRMRCATIIKKLDKIPEDHDEMFRKKHLEVEEYWSNYLLLFGAANHDEMIAIKTPLALLTLVAFYMRLGIPVVEIRAILDTMPGEKFGRAALLQELAFWKDSKQQAAITIGLRRLSKDEYCVGDFGDFLKCLFDRERVEMTIDDYISVMRETIAKNCSENRINLFVDFMMKEAKEPTKCYKQVMEGYIATLSEKGPFLRKPIHNGLKVRLKNLKLLHADTVCELMDNNYSPALRGKEVDRYIQAMPMGDADQWEGFFKRVEQLTPENIQSYQYVLEVLSHLSDVQYQAFIKLLREQPLAYKKLSRLHSIEFKDGGNSDSTWVSGLQRLFKSMPSHLNCEPLRATTNHVPINTDLTFYRRSASVFFDSLEDYNVTRIFGRSIELRHKEHDNDIFVIKVARPYENLKDLQTEYAMDAVFKGNLQSQLPKPIGLSQLTGFWDYLDTSRQFTDEQVALLKQQANAKGDKVEVFVYKPDASYLTYTDEISTLSELETSLNKSADDLMSLLIDHRLILPELISVMHNRNKSSGRRDLGRYQALVFILRQLGARFGTGRLDLFRQSTTHPNLRASGLADLAKTVSISELFDWSEGSFVSRYFGSAVDMHGSEDKASLAVLTELISEYFLVFSLLIDRWGADHEPKDDFEAKTVDEKWGPYFDLPKRKHWQQVAALKRRMYSRMYAKLMNIDESEAYTYVESLTKCNRHARQTAYFAASPELDNDYEAKTFSTKLFSRHTRVTFGEAREGSSLITETGDRHYGHVNGQNPTKEDQRIWTILMDNFMSQTTEQLSEGVPTIFGEGVAAVGAGVGASSIH